MSEKKPGFFSRLSRGLSRSSERLSDGVLDLIKTKLDEETLDELEEVLIAADLGAEVAGEVRAALASDKFRSQIDIIEVREELAKAVARKLGPLEAPLDLSGPKPQVVLFVGVNGSGKTTTLGKLAARLKAQGQSVVLGAGDTFRAAAIEQIGVWGQRVGAPVIAKEIGADAAGVAYDTVAKAQDVRADVALIDTAGRLQNKAGLMEELKKIVRVIQKRDASAPHHVILVLDATVGQNAIAQAQAFTDIAGVTGLAMTKLDGTAKGGVLVALASKQRLPIHLIGVGEGVDDLHDFQALDFARALAGLEDADLTAPR
ncbi:MAG: signal recognition particle-docking protein FtsY [Maricaulaceae bacterium]